jgi:hypothetical protein
MALSEVAGLLQDPNIQNMIKSYTGGDDMAKDMGLGGLGAGLIGGFLSRALLPGAGLGADAVNHGATTNEVQSMINSNQANNNAMLLLKDIQDSTAEVISSNTAGQIAGLQGQGDIRQAVADSVTSNFQQHAAITAGVTAGNAAIIADLGNVKADIAHVAAASALATADAKYQTLAAIVASENAIRTDIRDLKDTIPNARELDLQRQLGVAQADLRHGDTRRHIESGNVTVTQNVNQNNLQSTQQQQIAGLISAVNGLANHQQSMATAINVGGYQRANQTPTNINQ